MPSLKLDDGQIITESLDIVDYVLEKHGADKGLLLQDDVLRAQSQLFTEWFGNTFNSLFFGAVLGSQSEESIGGFLAGARQASAVEMVRALYHG